MIEKNLAALKRHKAYDRIAAAAPWWPSIRLASPHSAEAQTDHLEAGKNAFCYGIGHGDLPRAALAAGAPMLAVVILNDSIARAVFEKYDCTDWLNSDRVYVMSGAELQALYIPAAISPADVHLAQLDCHDIRDRLVNEIHRDWNERRALAMEAVYQVSRAKNAELGDLLELPDRITDAIVCGGGPSLAGQFEFIKKSGATVIAVSTALRSLMQAGIVPDYVTILDADPKLVSHFDVAGERRTLVYAPNVCPDIPRLWTGRRMRGDNLWNGGTVTHQAMDLAVKLGAMKITLAGVDFCFPGHRSHVTGAAFDEPIRGDWRPWVINGNGARCVSGPDMLMYLRVAEDYIKRTPHVKWFKVGRDGVGLKGAAWV